MALIRGVDGIVQTGTLATPVEVAYVTEWTATRTREITTRGPHINRDTLEKTAGAKGISGSLTADIPVGRDPGQSALDDAFEDGTATRLVLTSDQGYIYTIDPAIISEVETTGNATDGYQITFSFEDQSGYTVTNPA